MCFLFDFTPILPVLKAAVIKKSKELNTLDGTPYILKTSIRVKVRLLKESLLERKYQKQNVLSLSSMQEYQRENGDLLYIQGKYLDKNYLDVKLKYLAQQEETDYTLRIPSITQRVLDNPDAPPVRYRGEPERVNVSFNELILYLSGRVNKEIREAAIAVVNSMFDIATHQDVALPTDFQYSTQDVQLYEALIAAGARRHKAGTKALTRVFHNIHAMLSKDTQNLYSNIDFDTDELNELKHRKFTQDEIVKYFKMYLSYMKEKGTPPDTAISHFFFRGFGDTKWSPLMNTHLFNKKRLEAKRKKKLKIKKHPEAKKPSTFKPARGGKDFDRVVQKQEEAKVRRRVRIAGSETMDKSAQLLKRELDKISIIKSAKVDDASYIRLAQRLSTTAKNYKMNPKFQHIHQGLIETLFIKYVQDKSNSLGFKVAFMFLPTFLEKFVGQAFRDKYIILANSGIGYKGHSDFEPKNI